MSLQLVEATTDTENPNMLHITLKNTGNGPIGLALSAQEAFTDYSKGVWVDPKPITGFRVFMVTRRSIANPDELIKFRVELKHSLSSYPAEANLRLIFGGSGDNNRCTVSVPFHSAKR